MSTLQELIALREAKSNAAQWAVDMLKDAGISAKPGPDMADTGDGHFISDDEATAAMKALKAAGHKKRTSGSWNVITHKKDSGKGMTFDYDNDDGQVAVRFFDRSVNESKNFDHDECVKFVEGWAMSAGCDDMVDEGASLDDIVKQFWGDVNDEPDRKAMARKIGLTKSLSRDIMSNVLDNMHCEPGRPRTDEAAPKSNRMYGMDAPTDRESLISKIEGHTGTLESVPYNKISTEDLRKILTALNRS